MHHARMKHTIVQNTRNISIGKMISISTHESTEIKALNFSRPVNALMMVVEALQKIQNKLWTIGFGYSTCDAVTGERQQVGVFKPRKLIEHSHSVIMINAFGIVQHFDCHVEFTREDCSVDGPTSSLRKQ